MIEFNTVEEALEDLRQGKIILVTDDEDRENEGDFVCAAEFATTENVNFMAVHGKGLICVKNFSFHRWFLTIRTIMKPPLQYPLTILIRPQVSQLKSGGLPRVDVCAMKQSLRIFEGQGICSRSWQRKTVCWSETDIQRPPLI